MGCFVWMVYICGAGYFVTYVLYGVERYRVVLRRTCRVGAGRLLYSAIFLFKSSFSSQTYSVASFYSGKLLDSYDTIQFLTYTACML